MYVNKINYLDAVSPKFRMSTFRIQQLNCLHQGGALWAWRCLLVQGRNPLLVGRWKHFYFWWVCNQFSSFCLGRDWNPSSFNSSVNLQESCTAVLAWPPHPAPDTSPALPGLTCNTTGGFQLIWWFCPGPPTAVSMSSQTSMTGFVRQPLLSTHWRVLVTHRTYVTTQLPKSECPNSALRWPLLLDIHSVPQRQKDDNDIESLLTEAKFKPVISSLAACPINRF